MIQIKINEAIEIVKSVPQGVEFLNKNPKYDIIIKTISLDEIERILNEYDGLFPFKKQDKEDPFEIESISVISRNLLTKGYPKFRIYVRKDTNEVLRALFS
ncbi:MAG: hypothetical protein GY870_10310 [archaeon]|nr:hypothetical protein [archaeon]